MNLDDLIGAADPARERKFTGGGVDDARRLLDELTKNGGSAHPGAPPLRSDARARSRRAHSRLLAARATSIIGPVCAIAIPVAVVVGLVVFLRHDSKPAHPSTGTDRAAQHRSPADVLHVVAVGPDVRIERALINELGILRKPQNAAARRFNTDPKLGARLAQHIPFVAGLTRAVQLPDRVIFYLYVAQRSVIDLPRMHRKSVRNGGLGVVVRAPYQGFGECCLTPDGLNRPVGPQSEPYTMSQKPDWLYIELVPDKVASVRWTFTTNSRVNPSTRRRTVTVPVHNNIAAATLPNAGRPKIDTWYNARGQPIAQHTN